MKLFNRLKKTASSTITNLEIFVMGLSGSKLYAIIFNMIIIQHKAMALRTVYMQWSNAPTLYCSAI